LICIGCYCGLRLSDILQLTWRDILDKDYFEHVDIVGNFINVFINKSELLKHSTYEPIKITDPRRIVIEFAHPNTHKMFHVGHLRNITLGESLCRILAFQGAEIIRVNYQGDVGLHIAKCLYILKKANTDINSEEVKNMPLNDKIAFLGKAYADGNTAYEADEAAKSEIHEINRQIYEHDPAIEPLWKETRQWSLDYFDMIYKRVGTTFKRFFFESEVADRGLAIAKKAVEDNILVIDDGAIILDGKQHGVDTRVFVNKLGLPTYEGKELGLAELEFTEFGIAKYFKNIAFVEDKTTDIFIKLVGSCKNVFVVGDRVREEKMGIYRTINHFFYNHPKLRYLRNTLVGLLWAYNIDNNTNLSGLHIRIPKIQYRAEKHEPDNKELEAKLESEVGEDEVLIVERQSSAESPEERAELVELPNEINDLYPYGIFNSYFLAIFNDNSNSLVSTSSNHVLVFLSVDNKTPSLQPSR
jgi:hypothetical protein